jgi:hypothetical protein
MMAILGNAGAVVDCSRLARSFLAKHLAARAGVD